MTASEQLRLNATVGTLAPGKAADLIAVRGDPLSDVSLLEPAQFVMMGGTVYKHSATRARCPPAPRGGGTGLRKAQARRASVCSPRRSGMSEGVKRLHA